MSHSTTPRLRRQIARLQPTTEARPERGLEAVLSAAVVQRVLAEEGGTRKRIRYTPFLTFWAFCWQARAADHSCRAAVERVAAWKGTHAQGLDDEDTGAYCEARARRPESVPRRLRRTVGADAHRAATAVWTWCGRVVKLVDGSTSTMPDTAANQGEYPQVPSQKPGLGFPIIR
jgi:hypothetical protein